MIAAFGAQPGESAGNDLKIVQALLGHESIALTADTYTSVLPCLAHQAAEATAELNRATTPQHPTTQRHRPWACFWTVLRSRGTRRTL